MSEFHICGVLLMSRPEHSPVVDQALKGMAGVELRANEDGRSGRMVPTVEDDEYRQCATITQLATLDGAALSSLLDHPIDSEDLL